MSVAGAGSQPRGRVAFARFEVLREVGKGGMATIYLARDRERDPSLPERRVALKVIHPHLAEDPQLEERFRHEVRSHVGLVHPCIVEMIGWGEDAGGRLFMAMEFVDGPSLKALMTAGRRFPLDVALHVGARLLEALRHAHGRGIVHRDMKPGNVMIARDGQVKLADFGIATAADMTRLTATGSVIGTPAYMSPEQAAGRPIDARSDLFSVGVVLHEMLRGSNPFQADNPATTIHRVIHQPVRPLFEALPQTPPAVDALFERLLAKDPADRHPDAAAALADFATCIQEQDLTTSSSVMAAFLDRPVEVTRELDRRRARRHFELGVKAYDGGRGTPEGAIWEFFLASQLDPEHEAARQWLEQVTAERGYGLKVRTTPRMQELEARLKQDPDQVPVILQLAKMHASQGNFLQVIHYYRRAKALRPPDRYTQNQIDTLVQPKAAPFIEGTGVFETGQGRRAQEPPPRAPVEHVSAAGWGLALRELLGTRAGLTLVAAVVIVGLALVMTSGFDRAGRAALSGAPADDVDLDPEFARQSQVLARVDDLSQAGEHERAREMLERFVADVPESPFRSAALFRLGDAHERLGRRGEALSWHSRCAAEHDDGWALRSLERQGELLLVEDDPMGARLAYEELAERGGAEWETVSGLRLADLDRAEGRLWPAAHAYETLLGASEGDPDLRVRLQLSAAETYAELGEGERAADLFRAVREATDHRSEEFARAEAGLDRLGVAAPSPPGGARDPAEGGEDGGAVTADDPWAGDDGDSGDPWGAEEPLDDGADEGGAG